MITFSLKYRLSTGSLVHSLAVLAMGLVLISTNLSAAEFFVDSKAAAGGNGSAQTPYGALSDALNAAASGDTLTLAAGDYKFTAPKKPFDGKMVVIRAAKDAIGKVTVSHLDGSYSFLRFEGLVIPESTRINKARWVQFVRCTFKETEKQSYWGILFIDSEYCGLYGCAVKTLSTSQVSMGGVRHTEYRFNEITNGDSDAFQGGGDGILIEGNWVHDMHPAPGAHPDGIQLANTKNLTVRGNVFDTWNIQTFFFSWSTKETTYENILLENNVCTTARYHGLSAHPSTDMVVRNNLFIPDPKHPDGSEGIDLKNMQGKLTVQNNYFWQFAVEKRDQDIITNNIYMQKNWKYGLPGTAAVLSTPDACFTERAVRDYRLKDGSPAIGAAAPGTVPETDILGRKRPKDKPSIGPIEPQKDDKPFMEMWKAYFAKMQAEVQPPEPPADVTTK